VTRSPVRLVALGVAVVLVGFGVFLAVQKRNEPSVPRLVAENAIVPGFAFTTLDGRDLTPESLAGKSYVINFFNSWCIPCQKEHPELQAFYAAHAGERDFEMIGVVRDDEESSIRDYVAREGVTWPVAIGAGADSAAVDFGTTGQPETYVVAPDGVVVCGTVGPTDRATLDLWLQAARTGKRCT